MENETPAPGAAPPGAQPPPFTSPPRTPQPAAYTPPPLSSPASRPSKRSTGGGWKIAAILLGCFLALSLMGNFFSALLASLSVGTAGATHVGPNFQELVLEDNDARDKIAVLNLEGVISGQAFDPSGYNLVDFVEDQLDRCADDHRVKAVILKVDSPGGEVLASDEIYRRLERFQKKSGKPVIASMGGLAASGGYYISAPCRWIVANELTITGSIGVIMSGYNWRGLMDKVGVEPMVFKSGNFKDMLSPDKRPSEISAEERALVQGMVNETFERFKTVVREGRGRAADANGSDGRALIDGWEKSADGRILSGTEAHRLGLVDELGNFETAVERTLQIAGIEAANLVTYRQPFQLGMLFRLLGASEGKAVKIDFGLDLPKLETGRMYFLPPHFAP